MGRTLAAVALLAALGVPGGAAAEGEGGGGGGGGGDAGRLVGAFYYLGFRYPDEGLREPTSPGGDPLAHHFADPRLVNDRSVGWHRRQAEEALEAGIDFFVVVSGAVPGDPDGTRAGRALPYLVAALERVARDRGRAPRLAPFLDPRRIGDPAGRGPVDLASPWGPGRLYGELAAFFRRVPPRHRALLEGRRLVVMGPARAVRRYRSNLFDYLRARSRAEFGPPGPFFLGDPLWGGRVDAHLGWGGALAGAVIRDVALIGPGFDDSRLAGRAHPVRDREGGRFYERSWGEVLRDGADVVLLRSWNGLHEGTGICETREFGRRYLDLTRKFTRLFREHRPAPVALVPLAHPYPRPRPDLFWGREQAGADRVSWRADFGLRPVDGMALRRPPDGPVCFLEIGGQPCARTLGGGPATPRYVYFAVADSFLFDTDAPVIVELLFHDSGRGAVTLQYDGASCASASLRDGAYRKGGTIFREGSDRWRRVRFEIPDARFANRENGGTDLRFSVEGSDLVLREVVVRRGSRRREEGAARRDEGPLKGEAPRGFGGRPRGGDRGEGSLEGSGSRPSAGRSSGR